jgi:DNA repair protein RadA/Sms
VAADPPPWRTGVHAFDEVLGGGLTPASIVLLWGEPGLGKSTLALQVAAGSARARDSLYVAGEEPADRIKARAQRLELDLDQELWVVQTEALEVVEISAAPARVVVVDSIQALKAETVAGRAGSPGQVLESGTRLKTLARTHALALILTCHVGKEGDIAGPKALEHLVDVVLELAGNPEEPVRLLRVSKNRFGPIDVVGRMEMTARGLVIARAEAHRRHGP